MDCKGKKEENLVPCLFRPITKKEKKGGKGTGSCLLRQEKKEKEHRLSLFNQKKGKKNHHDAFMASGSDNTKKKRKKGGKECPFTIFPPDPPGKRGGLVKAFPSRTAVGKKKEKKGKKHVFNPERWWRTSSGKGRRGGGQKVFLQRVFPSSACLRAKKKGERKKGVDHATSSA